MKVKFDIRIVFLAFISSLLLSAPQAYAAPEKSVSEKIVEILKERGILKRMFQQKDNRRYGLTYCFLNLVLRSGNFFLVATFTFLQGNAEGKLTSANLKRVAPKSRGCGIC